MDVIVIASPLVEDDLFTFEDIVFTSLPPLDWFPEPEQLEIVATMSGSAWTVLEDGSMFSDDNIVLPPDPTDPDLPLPVEDWLL